MKVNLYFLVAIVYFFFNSVGLPFGLTWLSLFAPFFYAWILLKRKKEVMLPFLLVILPFATVHLLTYHVEWKSYAVSLLNLVLVYISCQAFYTFLKECRSKEKIFSRLLVMNFILCLVAIPLYFTPWWELAWMEQSISAGISGVRRLKLFTYEPSYYALLFTPLFFYFLLKFFRGGHTVRPLILLPMIFLPLLLSFSIGVIGATVMAMVIGFMIHFRTLVKQRRIFNTLVYAGAGMAILLVVLFVFFRDNPLFLRVENILAGEDTSGRGRTLDAFILSQKIIEGNEAWGIGLGQVKTMGYDIIRSYYLYYTYHPVAIPNAAAETLTIFGWVGLSLRLAIEVLLFFITRPWKNHYRLLLFLFIFIYQFTGSYLTNLAEYVVWIMAFTPAFGEFSVRGGRTGEAG